MNASSKKVDKGGTNEQTFNEALGMVLQTLRRQWDGNIVTEKNGSIDERGKADNLIYSDAMQPVVVEAAFDKSGNVDGDAIGRLGCVENETGREIMTAVALVIPIEVRDVRGGVGKVQKWLAAGNEMRYAIYSRSKGLDGESSENSFDVRYPDGDANSGYIRGNVKNLANLIELAATPDKRIKQIVRSAGITVRGCAKIMHSRLTESQRGKIAKKIGQPPDMHAMRVAACIWLNAIVLHDKLANAMESHKIPRPLDCETRQDFLNAWGVILDIDYKSVFLPALNSLEMLSSNGGVADEVLNDLRVTALKINALKLGYVADVGSDMFPELATDRKATAAFYTLPKVAELLSGLAFNLIPDEGQYLKIADFACGTGALLKAAYRNACRRAEPIYDSHAMHKKYMEDYLFGADIQPIAVHLTTAGLAGMSPSAPYDHSNIICADVRNGGAGSLNLLKAARIKDLFGQSTMSASDGGSVEKFRTRDNSFDLCIMNPPYTVGVGGKKVFNVSGITESNRLKSIAKLRSMIANSFASGRAGMASAFCLLCDQKLNIGGVMAAVLPMSVAGQPSWQKFRAHMLTHYSDLTVVGLVPGSGESFSSDTSMEEMLIIGRKCNKNKGGDLTIINLHQLPRDFIEAHEIARAVGCINKTGEVSVGDHVFGTCVKSHPDIGDSWGSVGAKSHELVIIAQNMSAGKFTNLGLVEESSFDIPMKILEEQIGIGSSHSSIGHLPGKAEIGAFAFRKIRRGDTKNLSLWEAIHDVQTSMLCEPTRRGELMDGRRSIGERALEQSSTLFISRNLRMTSQKLAAAMTRVPCMGGSAWTALLGDESEYAAYCLWLNSTLGLIARWQCAGKQHSGRARMQVKAIENFPCPVFSGKTAAAKHAVKTANDNFEGLSEMELMRCSMAWRDDVRKEIDDVVLQMLGLGKKVTKTQMQDLREEWCREPSVHGNHLMIKGCLEADGLL